MVCPHTEAVLNVVFGAGSRLSGGLHIIRWAPELVDSLKILQKHAVLLNRWEENVVGNRVLFFVP